MTAYLVGLLIGVLIGLIPVPFGQGVTVKLGMAGGVFLTSLLIGHFRQDRPVSTLRSACREKPDA